MKVIEQPKRLKYLIGLEEKEFDNTYGAFYAGFRMFDNNALQYYLMYIFRRMIFVLSAYYF